MSLKVQTMSEVYEDLLGKALTSTAEVNERTGQKVHTILGGEAFKLDLSDGRVPVPRFRKIHMKSVAAEVAWFLRGMKDVEWIAKYVPMWNQFAESDGSVKNAYGYRWRYGFGRDQIDLALKALWANRSDRRIYIGTWDPSKDGLGAQDKNVPCPVGFSLSITHDQLHSSLTIRSSDLFIGLPYDIAGHALLMAALAETMNVKMGMMTVMLAHPHLYASHAPMVEEGFRHLAENIGGVIMEAPVFPQVTWRVDQIRDDPDGYVDFWVSVVDSMKGLNQSLNTTTYNPKPEVHS